jgi:hypothetical protein
MDTVRKANALPLPQEAKAHIAVQQWIDNGNLLDPSVATTCMSGLSFTPNRRA